MKKIALLIKSMDTNGVSKSLINLLEYCDKKKFLIDIFVFKKKGQFLEKIPKSMIVNEFPGNNDLIVYSQKESIKKGLLFKLKRTFCAAYSRLFTNKIFVNKMLKKIPEYEQYDTVIAYQETPGNKSLHYGPAEVALKKFPNAKKLIYIHLDFDSSGMNNDYVRSLINGFDKIVFVSKSCMQKFKKNHVEFSDKAEYVYNLQSLDEIKELSKEKIDDSLFDKKLINFITVARLGQEKAHLRTLSILKKLVDEGYKFKYHIVGDGTLREEIEKCILNNSLSDYVHMYGNQVNPYPFIKNSDLFLLLSYHEAAPMVIEESYCLGIPVLSTNTVSAEEMIVDKEFICKNDNDSIYNKLKSVLDNIKKFKAKSGYGVGTCKDNKEKFEMFKKLVD